jgi:hypothetical protein
MGEDAKGSDGASIAAGQRRAQLAKTIKTDGSRTWR